MGAHDDPLDLGSSFDERHAGRRSKNEHALAERVGDHGPVRDQRHTSGETRWFPGREIDDVMVAPSVLDEEPLIVAGRAEGAIRQSECREDAIGGPARVVNAQTPWPISPMSGDIHVAPGLDHEVSESAAPQNGRRTVDGITLADSAQMYAHPFSSEECGAGALVHFDVPVVHERQPLPDFFHGRDAVVLIVIEFPHIGQCAERDIECPSGHFADLVRDAEDLSDFRADAHRLPARSGVQPHDVTGRAPDAHQVFEAIEFGEDRVECRERAGSIARPRGKAQFGSHRDACAFDQPWRGG